MSMLDVHLDSLTSVNEAHHTFLLTYRRDKQVVYGIVEGKEDPMFYRAIIERFLPESWSVELFAGGGREKVVGVFEALDWTIFDAKRVVFFLDRDLSDFLEEPLPNAANIYVTDSYSIENHIVSADVFMRLLNDVCGVTKLSTLERERLIEIFTSGLRAFEAALAPSMLQILAWRQDGAKANLNNFQPSSIFSVSGGRLDVKSGFANTETLLTIFASQVGARRYTQEELNQTKQAIAGRAGVLRIRGKYLLWFLAGLVQDVYDNISLFAVAYDKPPRMNVSFSVKNLMVYAAPRARVPNSLRVFIENTLLAFVSDSTSRSARF